MEEGDSQTIYVGPSHAVELSVGTYVSIKKNKQNLTIICQKMHANPGAFRRNNTNNSKEMQNAIRGIVDLIENTPFAENAEITKICVWTSNMIICADSAYREDFINSSKNIFQALSAHFVRVSPSQAENSSNNEEYQTLALIYQLLMSTRRPQESIGSKKGASSENEKQQDNNVKSMREKLLNKDFMKKILEINPEELAPSSELVFETQKMLIAFMSLFAQKKEKITAYGLIRSAKDRILEIIRDLYMSGKSNSRSFSDVSIHQALACFNAMIEILKISGKELAKHNLVVILTELLDNDNTTSVQLSVILRILLIITKQNLLSYKPSQMTLCLGKAFKVFEKVPSQAAQLITEIVSKDPLALNDITLSTTLSLLREITSRWNEACFLKRTQSQNAILRAQLTQMLLEIEGKMKYLVQIITMLLPQPSNTLTLALNGGLDVILFPLLNCLEFPVSSNPSPFELSHSSSQEDSSASEPSLKIEEPEQEDYSLGTPSNFPNNFEQKQHHQSSKSHHNIPLFAPLDVQLYESILHVIEITLLTQQCQESSNVLTQSLNINAAPIPSVSSSSYSSSNARPPSFRNEHQNIVFSKLKSIELPALLTALLAALKADYSRLASNISKATLLPKVQAFTPIAKSAARILGLMSTSSSSSSTVESSQIQNLPNQSYSTLSGLSSQRV